MQQAEARKSVMVGSEGGAVSQSGGACSSLPEKTLLLRLPIVVLLTLAECELAEKGLLVCGLVLNVSACVPDLTTSRLVMQYFGHGENNARCC